jgi:hypothetical protein
MDVTIVQLIEAAGQFRNEARPRIFMNNIPEKKRSCAVKAYGRDMGSDETVVVLVDESTLASGKSGLFLTDAALYQSMDKKRGRIPLSDIETIDVKVGALNKTLIINGQIIGRLAQGTQVEFVNLVWFFELITGKESQANEKLMAKCRAKRDAEEAKLEKEMTANPRLQEIRQQIDDLGQIYSFGTRKEIRYLPDIVGPTENIKAMTSGMMDGNTWLITCTDHRVIFLDKGMIYGLRQIEIPIAQVNSIAQQTGVFFAEIAIYDGSKHMQIKMVEKRTVKEFVAAVNAAIRKNNEPQGVPIQSQLLDVASQLEKLSNLKDKGVLTQEEFEQQKTKLLAS